ncbi:hypothetical protein LXL04_029821 [Taraxacum kok-saghyz]
MATLHLRHCNHRRTPPPSTIYTLLTYLQKRKSYSVIKTAMAENGSDQQQNTFHKKMAKVLVVISIIVLANVDLVSLLMAFFLTLLFVILFPVLIILSPLLIILLPVFIILAVIILTPWLITLVLVVFWIYDYVTGKHPIGADHVEKAREKIVEVAKKVKNKVDRAVGGEGEEVGACCREYLW